MTEYQKSDYHSRTDSQGRTQGGLGLTPLELDILQKLYYLRIED